MSEASTLGRELLEAPGAGQALFAFLEAAADRQQRSRALFEAVEETFLVNAEIRAAHADVVDVLGAAAGRAQATGEVRADIGAFDVLMMLKGICETAAAFQRMDPQISERQLDLMRAALSPPATPKSCAAAAPPSKISSAPSHPSISRRARAAAARPADFKPRYRAGQTIGSNSPRRRRRSAA